MVLGSVLDTIIIDKVFAKNPGFSLVHNLWAQCWTPHHRDHRHVRSSKSSYSIESYDLR